MGDLRASARAAQLGGGLPLFNHSLIMAVTQLSGFSLPVALMESSVPGEVLSLRPMLYHFTLASQTLSRTAPRSAMPRQPEHGEVKVTLEGNRILQHQYFNY